jgi:putative tributyrin esterase
MLRLLLFFVLLTASTASFAAKVDTLDIPSAAMHKIYRAAVVLPASYAKNKKASFPVLYLLHGAYGNFRDWLTQTSDKQLLHHLADQYNLIIVTPEGETAGFYLDSPVSPGSQFETYLTGEVLPKIDQTYRTVAERRGRVIAGFSMGGHGAMFLAARHPNLYCAAGSMSGALDLRSLNRRLSPADAIQRARMFAPILGSETENYDRFVANSVVNMVDLLHGNNLALIIDCGVNDGLIEINREVHRRLLYNHSPHDYTERPGAHNWEYWQNALPYQVAFLHQVLKGNGAAVPL